MAEAVPSRIGLKISGSNPFGKVRRKRDAMQKILTVMLMMAGACSTAHAAPDFTKKPITIVVPYSAGGGVDAMARAFGKGLGLALKTPVIVENAPGADGLIGAQRVIKAEPDGHTLLVTIPGILLSKYIHKSVPVEPIQRLSPVTLIALAPAALVVNGASGLNSLEDLGKHCKKEGANCSWGSGERYTTLLGKSILPRIGLQDMTNVTYKGGGPMLNDLMGGHVLFGVTSVGAAMPHHKAGKIRIVAAGADKRMPYLPDVPTYQELGMNDLPFAQFWYGLLAPKGTPEAVVNALNDAAAAVGRDEAVLRVITSLGASPAFGKPREFAARIKSDESLLADLIQRYPLAQE